MPGGKSSTSRKHSALFIQDAFRYTIQAFELFLELPKALKERKHVTSRIVTNEDVEKVLKAIEQAQKNGRVDDYHYLNYKALVLFGAFTGQRPLATIARLRAGQVKEAVTMKKPVVDILPQQDKIRMQHYYPLHPHVVEAVLPVLDGRRMMSLFLSNSRFSSGLSTMKFACCTIMLVLSTET
jgi:integrase